MHVVKHVLSSLWNLEHYGKFSFSAPLQLASLEKAT